MSLCLPCNQKKQTQKTFEHKSTEHHTNSYMHSLMCSHLLAILKKQVCVSPSCNCLCRNNVSTLLAAGEFSLCCISELQMFASFPNIKFDLNLFSCIVFFSGRVTFKHCTQGLHQLWQSADIAALSDVFVEIQIAKLQYSPEVNSHTHAAVATDGVMAERDSTLFLFLFICLCSPPLPVFFFFLSPTHCWYISLHF